MTRKALVFPLIWSLLFALGLVFEAVLNLKGQTLCERESCRIVNDLARLSHENMVFLGIAYLTSLAVLSALVLRGYRRWETPLVLLAFMGIGAETIFLLRQAFDYRVWCPFCLAVAVGVLGAALPVLWQAIFRQIGPEGIAGTVLGVAVAFFATSVSLEPIWKASLQNPENSSDLVLVYSSDCPHCHEVLDFCERVGIDITLCPKEKAIGLLRLLGLKGVPVLLVGKPSEVQVIQGSNRIIAFLERNFRAVEPRFKLPLFPEKFVFPQDEGVCLEGAQNQCK